LYCNYCKVEVVPDENNTKLVFGGLMECDSVAKDGSQVFSVFVVSKVMERLLGMSAKVYHDLFDVERAAVLKLLFSSEFDLRLKYRAPVDDEKYGFKELMMLTQCD